MNIIRSKRIRIFARVFLLAAIAFTGCDAIKKDATKQDPAPDINDRGSDSAAVKITTSNFEQLVLNNDQPVLLDFGATWCGPCQKLAPTIEALARENSGKILIGKVDVDEQKALAGKYQINGIPALLYFKNGELVKQQAGFKSKSAIQADIDDVLSL